MERRSIHLSARAHEQLRDIHHARRGRSLAATLRALVDEAHRRELGAAADEVKAEGEGGEG